MFFKKKREKDPLDKSAVLPDFGVEKLVSDEVAETLWAQYQSALQGSTWHTPINYQDYMGDTPTPLGYALTRLFIDGDSMNRNQHAMAAVSEHDQASRALILTRCVSHEITFVFNYSGLHGVLVARADSVYSSILAAKTLRLYGLSTRFDRETLGDDADNIDYRKIIIHHLDLLFGKFPQVAEKLDAIKEAV